MTKDYQQAIDSAFRTEEGVMPRSFPNVQCDTHVATVEPGYVVCCHLIPCLECKQHAQIAHFERSTESNMGVLACDKCHEQQDEPAHILANFIVFCASCLREKGLLPLIQ